jgi:hypothetical protein
MPLLVRKPQIATSTNMRSRVEAQRARVSLQRVLELRESLRPSVREHVHARKQCRRQQCRAHLACDDLRDLGETVRVVSRELLGRRIACGSYVWRGEPVGHA